MWQETKDGLYQHFTFADFRQAFGFMERVAEIAEELRHHPRWTNDYSNVEIWLITHSAGSIVTHRDYELAAAIDVIYQEYIV